MFAALMGRSTSVAAKELKARMGGPDWTHEPLRAARALFGRAGTFRQDSNVPFRQGRNAPFQQEPERPYWELLVRKTRDKEVKEVKEVDEVREEDGPQRVLRTAWRG